jgi:hypothetical protein
MAQHGQNESGDRWQPNGSVEPADRSMWQRQAARTLVAIVERHDSLPAIRWSVGRTGSACEWQQALGLVPGKPATHGDVTRHVAFAQDGGRYLTMQATAIARPSRLIGHRAVGGTRSRAGADPARPAAEAVSSRQPTPGVASAVVSAMARDAARAHRERMPPQGRRPVQGP